MLPDSKEEEASHHDPAAPDRCKTGVGQVHTNIRHLTDGCSDPEFLVAFYRVSQDCLNDKIQQIKISFPKRHFCMH